MRIEVHFDESPGFAEAFMGLLVLQHQSLRAMEVVSHHVYADLPGLNEQTLDSLVGALRDLPGFVGLRRVSAMPRELRLRQLEAVVEAFPDPVLAINSQGLVVLSNAAAKACWGTWLAGLPVDDVLARKGWEESDWQPKSAEGAEFLSGQVDFAGRPYQVERIPIQGRAPGAKVAGAVLVLRAPQRIAELRGTESEGAVSGEAGPVQMSEAAWADDPEDTAPASFSEAQRAFEAELLRRLYPRYPSSRKLAKRLKLSHTAVANKLRAHGIAAKR